MFSMYLELEMNRKIEGMDYISPGGYEIEFGGKAVQFDFCCSDGIESGNVACYTVKELDTSAFPITEEEMRRLIREEGVTKLNDIYVFIGEESADLKVANIRNIIFYFDEGEYAVPQSILDQYNSERAAE